MPQKQLTMKDVENVIKELKKRKLDLRKVPVYIGDDDELNGIHHAWFIQGLDSKSKGDDSSLLELLEERNGKPKEDNVILIS